MIEYIAVRVRGTTIENTDTVLIVFSIKIGMKPDINEVKNAASWSLVISRVIRYTNITTEDAKIEGNIFPTNHKGINKLKKASI